LYQSFIACTGSVQWSKPTSCRVADGCQSFWLIVRDNARDLLNTSRVVIDHNGNRDFVRRLAQTIGSTVLSESRLPLVREVKMEGSRSNNVVQLADMACGAVARSVSAVEWAYWGTTQKKEERKSAFRAGRVQKLPADLSLRNADREGHSSVKRAIRSDHTKAAPGGKRSSGIGVIWRGGWGSGRGGQGCGGH
jgi:hypothetical protein